VEKKALILIGIVLVLAFAGRSYLEISGKVAGDELGGIPEEEQQCMESCVAVGCEEGDFECMVGNSEKCMEECDAGPPDELDDGERCVQDCVDEFCVEGPDYGNCMNEHADDCDSECGMKGDAPDESEMSKEELCILRCVEAVDPTVICGNSQEGETGGELCQRCADECVDLYEGPCLNDEQIAQKERACETCEHCYGGLVMGPSGEGWDCIVDIECKDASSEFGDDPGSGPGIGDEGYVAPNTENEGFGIADEEPQGDQRVEGQVAGDQRAEKPRVGEPGIIEDFFEGIGTFFTGLFGG
jgi:hypothetical protein